MCIGIFIINDDDDDNGDNDDDDDDKDDIPLNPLINLIHDNNNIITFNINIIFISIQYLNCYNNIDYRLKPRF